MPWPFLPPPHCFHVAALLGHYLSPRLRRGREKGADYAVGEKDTGCHQRTLAHLGKTCCRITTGSSAPALDVKGANSCPANQTVHLFVCQWMKLSWGQARTMGCAADQPVLSLRKCLVARRKNPTNSSSTFRVLVDETIWGSGPAQWVLMLVNRCYRP
jgi:hypothetical protein